MLDFSPNKYYTINDLVNIMQTLRGENGCPWDKEQNHKSIRNNVIEEVYEAVEAIDTDNQELLKEELGDVLLQVIFHSQMEAEKGVFSFSDVVDGVCKKLIIRHPHVFGDITADSTDEVLKNWEAIKNKTKGTHSYTQTLTDVPTVLPALMRAQKVSQRAARAGMAFDSAASALQVLRGEVEELDAAVKSENPVEILNELGDVLFSCANVAAKLGASSEEALTKSTEKFISRFKEVEDLTRLDGIDMKSLSINELDVYWDKAKNSI
jgi:tetrapyrrole methylase family protein/MazG family protein